MWNLGNEEKHKLEELPLLIVKTMHLALQRMEMYGIEHSVSRQSIKTILKLLHELFEHAPSFTISRLGDEMLFDRTPLESTYFTERFVNDFNDFGIHSITFHRKMSDDEFSRWFHTKLAILFHDPPHKPWIVTGQWKVQHEGEEAHEAEIRTARRHNFVTKLNQVHV